MNDSCSFTDDIGKLEDRLNQSHGTIRQILEQVIECAYFIRDYCQDTASGMQSSSVFFLRLNHILALPFT